MISEVAVDTTTVCSMGEGVPIMLVVAGHDFIRRISPGTELGCCVIRQLVLEEVCASAGARPEHIVLLHMLAGEAIHIHVVTGDFQANIAWILADSGLVEVRTDFRHVYRLHRTMVGPPQPEVVSHLGPYWSLLRDRTSRR